MVQFRLRPLQVVSLVLPCLASLIWSPVVAAGGVRPTPGASQPRDEEVAAPRFGNWSRRTG